MISLRPIFKALQHWLVVNDPYILLSAPRPRSNKIYFRILPSRHPLAREEI
jgi:hypothetical protein